MLRPRDRRRLLLATVLQMATGIFDVIGVILLGALAALGAASLNGDAPPAAIRDTMEAVGFETRTPESLLVVVGLSACSFLIAKSLTALYFNWRILRFLANRHAEVSARLTRALLSRPLLEIQSRSSQETAYAITDGVSLATVSLLGSAIVVVTEITMLVGLGAALLVISPLVTLLAIVFFGLIVVFMQRILGRRTTAAGEVVMRTSIDSRALIQEALGTYREIWVLDRRERYATRVAELRGVFSRAMSDSLFIGQFPKYALEIALVVGSLALATTQFLSSDADSATLTVSLFFAAATRILPSILRLQAAALNAGNSAGAALPTFVLVKELLDNPTPERVPDRALRLGGERRREEFNGSIVVSGVGLTYPDGAVTALADVSFSVPAGCSLALVGPSGAGKSSLADVLMGVLEPDVGTVALGGLSPIDAISGWPGSIAYVPQSVYLADTTIRSNVGLGLTSDEVDDEMVWKALARAQLDDMVRGLPGQLDTEIGEAGTRLSGGQRQRLGLARALYTNPVLLVLDEATSALDTETEHAVTEVIRALDGDVTVVVIAHRLSTVLSSSVVLYLEDGRLISSGTFNEVRAAVPRLNRQAELSGL